MKIGRMPCGQRREVIHRDVVLAARGAQREQALLDAIELVRIVVRGKERSVELRADEHVLPT